jgi:recombinational DNA repair protein RecR
MAFNTAIQKVVKKLAEIPGIGTSVTFRKVSAGSYNSTSGEVNETVTDTSVKAVFEDVNQREVTELVQADDRKCIIAANALSSAPSTADRVIVSGVQHSIIRIKVIDQAGLDISYQLFLRA